MIVNYRWDERGRSLTKTVTQEFQKWKIHCN